MPTNQINQILSNVTTPLTLAALFLLLAFTILNRMAKKPDFKLNKDLIKYGFTLAVILSVLANVTYLVQASFVREIRISGVVRDSRGNPLGRAIADIGGRGRGITDNYGAFQFIIPDVWADSQYDMHVSLDGYEAKTVLVTGKRPKPVQITLDPIVLSAETFVTIEAEALISHYIGIPAMELGITMRNPLSQSVAVENCLVRLKSPSNKEVVLFFKANRLEKGGMVMPPLTRNVLESLKSNSFIYRFASHDEGILSLAQQVNSEFTLSPTKVEFPDPNRTVYSAAVVSSLRNFMLSHFVWESGTWNVSFSCTANGNRFEKSARFELRADTVSKMKNIQDLYHSGIGVIEPWSLWTSENVTPIVAVSLK